MSQDGFFSVELVCKLICELKTGKAAGIGKISTEHLVHCHPLVHVYLTYLFNLMLLTGYVPSEFGTGVIFPIPKGNVNQKVASYDDFRGITVSPVISKLLENGILERFGYCMGSSDSQFGFKKGVGCSHAIYTLNSVIKYFVDNGSTVNICSLDLAKAFDRSNHFAIFCKLIDRNMPVNVIMILVDWYKKSVGTVNWKGSFSSSFPLQAGVRQGGCISPINFAILVDDVITAIHNSGLGCHINNINFGILMYADDLVLVSASIFKLQLMINVCLEEFNSLDLEINVKKSACIRIGKNFHSNCSLMSINNNSIAWSNNFKYLGVVFNSGKKVLTDLKSSRSKFFRSFNSIYSRISRANESVIVSLLKSCCIPILMYSVEAIDLNKTEVNRLQNPVSLAFGKIFKTFDDNNTISSCMFYMNCLPLNYEYIYAEKLIF